MAPAACSGSGSESSATGTAGSAGSSRTSGGTHASTSGSSSGGTAGASLGGSGGSDSTAGSPDYSASGASGVCDAVIQEHALGAGIHVPACTVIDYPTNPPSSGQHYPVWGDFGVYDFPLPRGYWVHNLEHGAVVVAYNCATDCAVDIAAAKAWLAQLSPDAACLTGPPRVLLVPDPKLDVAWAASSWGFTLRANCFDADTFSDFYTQHAGQALAPEFTVCGTGENLRLPDAETCGAK